MSTTPRQAWADRLESHARQTLGPELKDGIRQILSGPTGRLRMAQLVGATLLGSRTGTARPARTLDEQLWSALAIGTSSGLPCSASHGPLTGEPSNVGIEVWTEIELASIHAAWSLGPAWRAAAERAAHWVVDVIQPDNATNHPWAIHVFVDLAAAGAGIEFDLYAQTLLHNCLIHTGESDAFSSLILQHAAGALQAG